MSCERLDGSGTGPWSREMPFVFCSSRHSRMATHSRMCKAVADRSETSGPIKSWVIEGGASLKDLLCIGEMEVQQDALEQRVVELTEQPQGLSQIAQSSPLSSV